VKDDATVWYRRDGRLPSGLWSVTAYQSDEHPDGRVAEGAGEPAGTPWIWRTREPERGILAVDVAPALRDQAPPLWFVNVDEPTAKPPATNLVAFATDTHPAGTIVDRYAFATAGVDNALQAGAVRWYRTGVVHQIFVAPEWRRRLVASVLLYTASALHQANGWPDHLRSDGRRTDLGELFAAGARHPQRIAPLSETMPSMDPTGEPEPAG
jgi:GNAT superfamily N-acetyltransferase